MKHGGLIGVLIEDGRDFSRAIAPAARAVCCKNSINPYVSNPDDIPATDPYADVPLYGRYFPRQDDFCVDGQHVNSRSAASLRYWKSVLEFCTESVRIYPADEGGRDVFALGSVIVKSSHLHSSGIEIDYSYADANEAQAIAIAKSILKDVRVAEILFSGKINGRQVLVQERLPGVGLNVAWPYLSHTQQEAFKRQARDIVRQLHAVKPTDGRKTRSHVVQDPNILSNGRINPLEGDILFSDTNNDPDISFMHNEFTEYNIIVDNDRIVGLVGWEMSGFFGWRTAGEVHRRIRTPQREHFANVKLSEEKLQEIMVWKDLYDVGVHEAVV
ncbi:kinase-like domain protein [Podospora australis]|uniref:Kinase-like domain protein n=1 Tax=Podospora australis TaxID=1536484 RepID=A0AAN6WZB3_9PEZI|nr:kinase-like domain protein [Podospora australis]